MKMFRYVGAVAVLAFGQPALAANFDFTGMGSGPSDVYSATADGITIDIATPTPGHHLAYFNPLGTNLDGIGASSGLFDPDWLQEGEALTVTFSTLVSIDSLVLNKWDVGDKALLSFDGGSTYLNGSGLLPGSHAFDLSSIGYVDSITIAGAQACFANAFVLGGLQVTAVPVPAAAWLFGTALLGLGGVARRRRQCA